YAQFGYPWGGMDDAAGGLEGLLALAEELGPMPKADKPGGGASADGRRTSQMPLIEVARTKTRDEAMAALEEWRSKHPEAASALEAIDVLVDGMRGPSSIWYRIRINLQHVPEGLRPPQEPLIADYSPWVGYQGNQWRRP
ncbi:MAG: DNA polymerase domain-containing protein, partial [Actinobacteria bacterium]|nr:DNA polymerase domain-containing protein [Actinomycetota bacterium]